MVFDYWLLRRARLDLAELYRSSEGGPYWFSGGYNWRALVAVAVGVLPGAARASCTPRRRRAAWSPTPNFFDQLYRYGVFVAFGISAATYVGLSLAARGSAGARTALEELTVDVGVTFQTDPPASRVVELTVRAEQLGFSHAWTFDSHILWQEPYVIHTQMLAARSGSWSGPFVTNPATRDPTVTASVFATLNDMFGNRTICGIGRGDSARRVLGPQADDAGPDRGGDARDQGAGRGPRDRDAGRRGADPVGARRQARRVDGRLRAEGARARRPQGGRLHPPARRPGDPAVDGRRTCARRRRRRGATRTRSPSASPRPAYLGDDLDHAREQCRWFGGMVGNHVADLVRRYGEDGEHTRRR